MANEHLIETLEEIGLSAHESAVYLASLALGPANATNLASAASIKRTTVYPVVEALKQKGLMNIEMRGFKRLFAAEDPQRLEGVLESRKELFRKNLPEFAALYNLRGGESTIKYYEGLAAVKQTYENLLRDVGPKEDYLILSDEEQWLKLDPEYFKDFIERRAKLPIQVRVILQDSPLAREAKKFAANYNREVKLLAPKTKLSTNLVIIPRRVVIHQLTPPVLAIAIENPSIVQMHREMFEIMWNSLSS